MVHLSSVHLRWIERGMLRLLEDIASFLLRLKLETRPKNKGCVKKIDGEEREELCI